MNITARPILRKWDGGGSDVYAVQQSNFVVLFVRGVTTRNPKFKSTIKNATDPVGLWQTCHSTYCKSMYHQTWKYIMKVEQLPGVTKIYLNIT